MIHDTPCIISGEDAENFLKYMEEPLSAEDKAARAKILRFWPKNEGL